jgi:hypothetical protein
MEITEYKHRETSFLLPRLMKFFLFYYPGNKGIWKMLFTL